VTAKKKVLLRDPDVLCVGDEQVSCFVYVIGVAERVLPALVARNDLPGDAARNAVAYADALWKELQKRFETPVEAPIKQD
jgi:hypothetical protein